MGQDMKTSPQGIAALLEFLRRLFGTAPKKAAAGSVTAAVIVATAFIAPWEGRELRA